MITHFHAQSNSQKGHTTNNASHPYYLGFHILSTTPVFHQLNTEIKSNLIKIGSSVTLPSSTTPHIPTFPHSLLNFGAEHWSNISSEMCIVYQYLSMPGTN